MDTTSAQDEMLFKYPSNVKRSNSALEAAMVGIEVCAAVSVFASSL